MPRHPLELALKTPHWSLRSAFRMRDNLFAAMPQEIDRIRAERTGQPVKTRKITSETSMYRFTGFLLLALLSGAALADTYQLTWGWTDPTTYLPSDSPTYEAQYRVSAGAIVPLPATATPAGTASVTADPGAPIEVSVRNVNGALASAWSTWVTATAPYPATQPGEPVGLTITVTRSGL